MRFEFVFAVKFILNGTAQKLVQPGRWKIYQALREKGPSYVEEIAEETKIHPRLVSHHLDVLQEQGLVECKYEISNLGGSKRGVAVRICKTTPKGELVLADLRESVK